MRWYLYIVFNLGLKVFTSILLDSTEVIVDLAKLLFDSDVYTYQIFSDNQNQIDITRFLQEVGIENSMLLYYIL